MLHKLCFYLLALISLAGTAGAGDSAIKIQIPTATQQVVPGAASLIAGVTISNAPAGRDLTVTVRLPSSTVSVPTTVGARVTGNGTAKVKMVGSQNAVNAALARLTVTPRGNTVSATLGIMASAARQKASASVALVASDVVAQWNFNAAGATIADASGNGHVAQWGGGKRYGSGTSGVLGLDGSGPAIVSGAGLIPQAFTLSAWIRASAPLAKMRFPYPAILDDQDFTANTGVFFGSYMPQSGRIGIRLNAGSGYADRGEVDTSITTVGKWVHVAVTYDGTALTLYRNGRKTQSVPAALPANRSGAPLRIGAGFEGALDDVRIYRGALPLARIADIAKARASAISLAVWADEEATGTVDMPVTLTATVVAEGGTTVPTSIWRQVSGPATADIATPTARTTIVDAPVAGQYVFEITVTRNDQSVSEQVLLTVLANGALDAGQVARWTFDEADGLVAVDVTGHGHDGVLWGAQRVPGVAGGAVSMSGGLTYVGVPGAVEFDQPQFSVSAWIKAKRSLSQMASPPGIVNHDGVSGSGWLLGNYGSRTDQLGLVVGSAAAANGRVELRQPWNDVGRWAHLCATWDGGTIRLYRDGRLFSASSSSPVMLTPSPAGVFIGLGWEGSIDDVRIWNRPLEPVEVRQLAVILVSANG